MEMEPNPSAAHNLPPWKPNSRINLKWLITQDGKETIWQGIICAWLEIKADDSQTEVQHKNKLFHMPRGWYILPVSHVLIQLRELQAATSLTCMLHNNQKKLVKPQVRDLNSQFEKQINDQTEGCSAFHRFHPSSVNCCLFPVWVTGAAGIPVLTRGEAGNQTGQVTSPSQHTQILKHAHVLLHSHSGVIKRLQSTWCKFLVCGKTGLPVEG